MTGRPIHPVVMALALVAFVALFSWLSDGRVTLPRIEGALIAAVVYAVLYVLIKVGSSKTRQ
jgi:uncharacterized BrkB/YihY/UPF0761 family membrane protein